MEDLRKENNMWRGLIILIVVASALSLAAVEIYLRLSSPAYDYSKLYEPSPNPRMLYELRPQASITFDGEWRRIPPTQIQISASGLRDRDYPIPKGKAFRILILGDSVTFGWGVNLEDTFVKKLEKILNEREGREFEVINLGVPGYNTRQEVEFFKEKGLALDPDLVLVGFLDNDFNPPIDFPRVPRLLSPLFHHLYLVRTGYRVYLWIESYKNRTEARRARRARSQGSLLEVTTALEELTSIGAQRGFAAVLIVFDLYRKETRQLIGLGPQMGLKTLDLSHSWRPELSIPGDWHPNAEAYSIHAEEIYRFLKQNDLFKKSSEKAQEVRTRP